MIKWTFPQQLPVWYPWKDFDHRGERSDCISSSPSQSFLWLDLCRGWEVSIDSFSDLALWDNCFALDGIWASEGGSFHWKFKDKTSSQGQGHIQGIYQQAPKQNKCFGFKLITVHLTLKYRFLCFFFFLMDPLTSNKYGVLKLYFWGFMD